MTKFFFVLMMVAMVAACQQENDVPAITTTSDLCKGVSCDDGNACTDDKCTEGKCTNAPNVAPCDDGNACTSGDSCKGGKCVGGPIVTCDDGNPCTDETCNPKVGYCHAEYNTVSCNDGNACTKDDICGGGKCSGTYYLTCDDGNVCTTDACDPKTGCTHIPAEITWAYKPCDDGNVCTTGDKCSDGKCVGGPSQNCNDNNVCTTDACDPKAGCTYTNNTAPCNDSNVCTTDDGCNGGQCISGTPINCDDGNECNDDSCDPQTGCVNKAAAIAEKCADIFPLTLDVCENQKCVHLPVDNTPTLQCDGTPAMYVPAAGTYLIQTGSEAAVEIVVQKGWVSATKIEVVLLTGLSSGADQAYVLCKAWPCFPCYKPQMTSTASSWSCGADGKGSGEMTPCPE